MAIRNAARKTGHNRPPPYMLAAAMRIVAAIVPVRKIALENPNLPLVTEFGIQCIPTLIRFKDGMEQNRIARTVSFQAMQEFVIQATT